MPLDGCDYVNASWIKASLVGGSDFDAIAAQGPKAETLGHFLQMVMEQSVDCIVMLTKLSEKYANGIPLNCRHEH